MNITSPTDCVRENIRAEIPEGAVGAGVWAEGKETDGRACAVLPAAARGVVSRAFGSAVTTAR